MKMLKEKKKKIEYDRVVKLVKEARREAEKFVQKNIHMDTRLQIKYS